jgi:hypothetical protein
VFRVFRGSYSSPVRDFENPSKITNALVLEATLFVALLLWTCGFIFGIRPSRHDLPTRMLAVLALYSAPVFMAGWVLTDKDRFAWLQRAVSDSEGLAVAVVLELVFLGGTVVLLPGWGYAIGRTVRWRRWRAAQPRS